MIRQFFKITLQLFKSIVLLALSISCLIICGVYFGGEFKKRYFGTVNGKIIAGHWVYERTGPARAKFPTASWRPTYQYVVKNRTFTSDTNAFGETGDEYFNSVEQAVGKSVKVYYEPSNPRVSSLYPKRGFDQIVFGFAYFVALILFAFITFCIFFYEFKVGVDQIKSAWRGRTL